MKVKVKKLYQDAELPRKGSPGSLCYDICSHTDLALKPMFRGMVGTGLAFECPEGMGLDIRPRSGKSFEGLHMLNAPGTLDSDYRGELMLIFVNLTNNVWNIKKGDKVAQIRVIEDIWHHVHHDEVGFEEVQELSETKRGGEGFGSTGN